MQTTVAHVASLLFYGKLSREMYRSYLCDKASNAEHTAHGFMVQYCFLRAPTPDIQRLADAKYSEYSRSTHASRADLFRYNSELNYETMNYEITNHDVDIADHWGINFPDDDDSSIGSILADTIHFAQNAPSESEAETVIASTSVTHDASDIEE